MVTVAFKSVKFNLTLAWVTLGSTDRVAGDLSSSQEAIVVADLKSRHGAIETECMNCTDCADSTI